MTLSKKVVFFWKLYIFFFENKPTYHVQKLCHTYEWVTSHTCEWVMCVCHMCVTRVWRDSFICVWRDSFICVWRVCDVTHSYRHVTHMNEWWHTHEWVMSHIWMCDVTHSWMSHVTPMNASYRTYKRLMSHIHTNSSKPATLLCTISTTFTTHMATR